MSAQRSPRRRIADAALPPLHADTRVGPIFALPALLTEHGFDPRAVLRGAGLDPRLFDDPDNRIPLVAIGALAERCASLTGCPHFGLLIGQRFRVESLGILGEFARHCATVGDALRAIALHIELQDRGAVVLAMEVARGRAALGYSLFTGATPGSAHILDATLAMEHQLLRELCGPAWKPVLVQLSHSRPADVVPFRRFFGPALEFDARLSAIVFDSRWLGHRIAGADPAALRALTRAVEAIESREAKPFAAKMRRAIHATMFTASADTAHLARLAGLHERTLRRHLAEEGTSVRELVGGVRHELAQHLLRNTAMSVSEIAATLGYSDVAVFARAFRAWTSRSPREWRARHRHVR